MFGMVMALFGVKKGRGFDWQESQLENSMEVVHPAIHVQTPVLRARVLR